MKSSTIYCSVVLSASLAVGGCTWLSDAYLTLEGYRCVNQQTRERVTLMECRRLVESGRARLVPDRTQRYVDVYGGGTAAGEGYLEPSRSVCTDYGAGVITCR